MYLFSAAQRAVLQGFGRLVFALSSVEGAQVLEGRRHSGGVHLGRFVPAAVFAIGGVFSVASLVLFAFFRQLPYRLVVT